MKNRNGFTLLEILLATLLTAIVLGAVYSSYFLMEKAREGAGGSLRRLYEAEKTMDMMDSELAAIVNSVTVTDREYYGKETSGLSFGGFSPKRGIISAVSYSVLEEKGRLSLQKEIAWPGGRVSKGVLLDDIDEFMVEAYSGGKWVKTFQSNSAPDAVRVTLKFTFKGRPVTLSDTVVPRIGKSL